MGKECHTLGQRWLLQHRADANELQLGPSTHGGSPHASAKLAGLQLHVTQKTMSVGHLNC